MVTKVNQFISLPVVSSDAHEG